MSIPSPARCRLLLSEKKSQTPSSGAWLPTFAGRKRAGSPASVSPRSALPNDAPAAGFPNRQHPVARLRKDQAPARGHVRVAQSGAEIRRAPLRGPCVPSSSRPPRHASIRLEIRVPYVCTYEPALEKVPLSRVVELDAVEGER